MMVSSMLPKDHFESYKKVFVKWCSLTHFIEGGLVLVFEDQSLLVVTTSSFKSAQIKVNPYYDWVDTSLLEAIDINNIDTFYNRAKSFIHSMCNDLRMRGFKPNDIRKEVLNKVNLRSCMKLCLNLVPQPIDNNNQIDTDLLTERIIRMYFTNQQ